MLGRVLRAVFSQDYPRDRLEVIAVLDGCTDDTASALQSLDPPCQFRYIRLPKSGQAAARNKGIQSSIGEVMVFIDDDLEPSPGFLRTHAEFHARADNLVVQGFCPLSPELKRNLHRATIALWWDGHSNRLAHPGHRLGHNDLGAGNLSVRRKHLLAVGGFDEDFRGYGDEDYELGLRLASLGLKFRFSREAIAWHHYDTSLPNSLKRAREEARADVIYGRKYPYLKPTFRLFTLTQDRSLLKSIIRTVAFRSPGWGDKVAGRLTGLMDVCERYGLRGTWARLYLGLRRYYYWRGLKDSLGSYAGLKEYLGDHWIEHPAELRTKVVSIDLRKGIPAIEGLDGYRAVYILLREGPKPLAWLWCPISGVWLSPRDIEHAIERQALLSAVANKPDERRLAGAVLPSIFANTPADGRWGRVGRDETSTLK